VSHMGATRGRLPRFSESNDQLFRKRNGDGDFFPRNNSQAVRVAAVMPDANVVFKKKRSTGRGGG